MFVLIVVVAVMVVGVTAAFYGTAYGLALASSIADVWLPPEHRGSLFVIFFSGAMLAIVLARRQLGRRRSRPPSP
jgi:protein-S-isoprenylcysteine O-methyltransferase Ste14